jgi:hypothetical protein
MTLRFHKPAHKTMTSSMKLDFLLRKACTKMLKRFIPPIACSIITIVLLSSLLKLSENKGFAKLTICFYYRKFYLRTSLLYSFCSVVIVGFLLFLYYISRFWVPYF